MCNGVTVNGKNKTKREEGRVQRQKSIVAQDSQSLFDLQTVIRRLEQTVFRACLYGVTDEASYWENVGG